MYLQMLPQMICQSVERLTGHRMPRGVKAQVTVGAVKVEANGAYPRLLRGLLDFRRHACQFVAPGTIPVVGLAPYFTSTHIGLESEVEAGPSGRHDPPGTI